MTKYISMLLFLWVSTMLFAQQNINLNWTALGGPAGPFKDIAQQNSNTYYAATSSGLYKSTNSGNLWVKLSVFDSKDVIAVEADANTVLVVVYETTVTYSYYINAAYVVYRSTDGGSTFTQCFSIDASTSYYSCYPIFAGLYKKSTGDFYVNSSYNCSSYGYYSYTFKTNHTTDGGVSWVSENCIFNSNYYTNPPPVDTCDNSYQYMTFKGDTIISVRSNKLTVSPDGGNTKTAYTIPNYYTNENPIYKSGKVWLVGVNRNTLVRATNFTNWTEYTPQGIDFPSGEFIRGTGLRGTSFYLLTNKALYRATNANATNFIIVYDSDEDDLLSMTITGNNIWLSESDGDNRLSTNNGSTWAIKNTGMNNAFVAAIFDVNNSLLIRTTPYNVDFRKYTISNNTWSDFIDSSFYSNQSLNIVNYNNTLYAYFTNSYDSLKVSTDNGVTWVTKPYIFYNVIQAGTRVYGNTYADNTGVAKTYYSDNNGNTWTLLNGGNGEVFYGQGNKIYRKGATSLNGGATWTTWTPYPASAGYVDRAFAVNGKIVTISLNTALTQVSNDNGITWQQTGEGIAGVGPSSLYNGNDYPSIQVVDSLMFMTFGGPSNSGTYISKDYGAHWGYADKSQIKYILKKGSFLYGSRNSTGLWKTDYNAIAALLNFSDISLTQTAPIAVSKGVPFTIKLTLKNNGTVNTTTVKVKDILPSLFTVNSVTPSAGTYSASTGIWNIGNVNANTIKTLTFNVTASDTTSAVKNFAQVWTASPTEADNTPGNDTDQTPNEDDEALSTITVAPPSVDLSLITTTSNTNPTNGDTITFTLKLANAQGFMNATGVKVKYVGNPSFQFVSATPSQGTFSTSTGIWNVGAVNANTEKTLVIKAIANIVDGNQYPNYTVEVVDCTQNDYDSVPADGTGDDSSYGYAYILKADLFLTMSADLSNDSVIYTLRLFKDGGAALSNLKVKDKLPTGLTYISHDGPGTYNPNTGIWTIDNNNVDNTLIIVAKKTGTVDEVTNFAQVWTATPAVAITNSQPGNNSTNVPNEADEAKITHRLLTPQADISLELFSTYTYDAGIINGIPHTGINYQLNVYNNSNQYADNVKVKFEPPVGAYLNYNPGNFDEITGLFNIGDIPENSFNIIYFTYNVPTNNNTITAFAQVQSLFPMSDPDSTPGNDTNQTADEDDEALWIQNGSNALADLTCSLEIPNPNFVVGSNVNYTLTTTNNGIGSCIGQTTRVFISSTPTLDLNSVIGWLDVGISPMSSGQSNIIPVTQDFGAITPGQYYLFAVCDFYEEVNELNEGNNISGPYTINIQSSNTIDLTQTIIINNNNPKIGDTITYTLQTFNLGGINATGVRVKDLLPTGVTYVSHNASQGTYTKSTGIWYIGTIASNDNKSLTIKAKVTAAAGNTITNFVQVWTASPNNDPDSAPGNNTSNTPVEDDENAAYFTVSNNTDNLPDLVLSSLVAPSSGSQGAVVDFTFKLDNIGTTTASGDYTIGCYLSTDNTWSANDIEAGIVPTGNTPVNYGFTVPAAITVPANLAIGNYYLIIVADRNFVINETNENNNTVSQAFAVTSNSGGSGMDLNLTMTSSVQSVAIYNNYSLTLKVTNTGSVAATNVSVNLNYNASNAPFTSSTVTQGSYDNYNKIWTVGNIAAGSSATLTLTLFTLTSNAIVHFAQVQTASPTDVDSSPGNDSNQTANEDDEAAFILNASVATLLQNTEPQFIALKLDKVYPNPTANWLCLDINSILESEVPVFVYDSQGKIAFQNKFIFNKGMNNLALDISNLPSGRYTLILSPKGEKVLVIPIIKG